MLSVRRRLGAPILFTSTFLLIVILLLYGPGVKTHLLTISQFRDGVWRSQPAGAAQSSRLVVFGDSWVDSMNEKVRNGKAQSWTQTLCSELDCVSHLNFAKSQAPGSFPAFPPTGAVISNEMHKEALTKAGTPFLEQANFTLPDLTSQVQSYIALPKSSPQELSSTTFVISAGFWEIYYFASLDFDHSSDLVDTAIDALFAQLDSLYDHFVRETKLNVDAVFQLVVLKVLDPTLAPGWQTQRPYPLSPGNVAEQQRNAVYLTERWNNGVENRLYTWMKKSVASDADVHRNSTEQGEGLGNERFVRVKKSIYYYNLASYVLDIVVECSLQNEGLSDAAGLGTQTCPFSEVYLSCVSDTAQVTKGDDITGYEEVDGRWVCKDTNDHLWWDGWSLGPAANEQLGKEVAEQVVSGDSFDQISEDREDD